MKNFGKITGVILGSLLIAVAASAQTTSFPFEGEIPKAVGPATDTYEMEFRLMDAAVDGTQIGSTNAIPDVAVKNRSFLVRLDFGATALSGADRFIEVSVRRRSLDPFTTISPRSPILSAPYSIRSLTATTADTALNLDGIPVADIVQTTDSRLGDDRDPNPGSNNYIQNTTIQQSPANFNISGNGTVGGTLSGDIVNATTQYNLSGNRVLAAPGFRNTFLGINTGTANTGGQNSFFGTSSGQDNTQGDGNSFFGSQAGMSNTTGDLNSFFGTNAGRDNTTGGDNVFIGAGAGRFNTTASFNTFVGGSSGSQTATGSQNSFFGFFTGNKNTTGRENSFFGTSAGNDNTTGSQNAFFGEGAGFATVTGDGNSYFGTFAAGSDGLNNASAIGFRAVVTQSNSLVLGGITGVAGGTSVNVGIGTTAPADRLDVNGIIRVATLGAAGATALCRNGLNQISDCLSSRSNGLTPLSTPSLLDALNLQQEQIAMQQRVIDEQKAAIAELKAGLCQASPFIEICKAGSK